MLLFLEMLMLTLAPLLKEHLINKYQDNEFVITSLARLSPDIFYLHIWVISRGQLPGWISM